FVRAPKEAQCLGNREPGAAARVQSVVAPFLGAEGAAVPANERIAGDGFAPGSWTLHRRALRLRGRPRDLLVLRTAQPSDVQRWLSSRTSRLAVHPGISSAPAARHGPRVLRSPEPLQVVDGRYLALLHGPHRRRVLTRQALGGAPSLDAQRL